MRISLGCDHGGYELKEAVKKHLASLGHDVNDLGCDSVDAVDYPDYGAPAARAVATGECARGILICKSGIGMSIVGNKIAGVRAALCLDEEMAELSRRHNDANVLVLSGGRTPPARACRIVDVWLSSAFEGGRHGRRMEKVKRLEKK
jgi:RpiB/LacA/LacB family sugar-phosphate isomerase